MLERERGRGREVQAHQVIYSLCAPPEGIFMLKSKSWSEVEIAKVICGAVPFHKFVKCGLKQMFLLFLDI